MAHVGVLHVGSLGQLAQTISPVIGGMVVVVGASVVEVVEVVDVLGGGIDTRVVVVSGPEVVVVTSVGWLVGASSLSAVEVVSADDAEAVATGSDLGAVAGAA
ncbi:MAG TPA: hypothetical protein VKR22_09035 [Acidimicrobiales bacterium]|nr:hypothetical protein [Acidimicrobiales bacterium]